MANKKNGNENCELEAPDGGWGYVVAGATVVIFITTIIPMTAFGLIYGDFLKSIGDETTGTTLSNGMFNTVNSFTGLLANGLLSRYSYRKVGFMGSIIYSIGAIGIIFSENLIQLIVSFGVLQGIGFGLLMPASLSAFNAYFDKKMTVMMSISQALMIAFSMVMPQLASWSMTYLGFKGTLISLAVFSGLCLPSVATLQPVKRHMKKVHFQIIDSNVITVEEEPKVLKGQVEPLMQEPNHLGASHKSLHLIHGRARTSIISLGDRVASVSVTTINEIKDDESNVDDNMSLWQSFLKSMDMSLLKNFKYLNISIGLALCFTGDLAFISIIPLMLGNIGFKSQEIAFMMAVFFGSDLVSRILLTIVSSMVRFRSRFLVLFTSVFIVISRTALVSNDSYTWKLIFLGILGFLRCFIQTPLPLVFSEEYSDRFSTAYSLFMAVNGVVSLICGPLMSFVKSYTQSDIMVCHILTAAYIIFVIAWTAEMTFFRKKNKEKVRK